MNKEYMNIKLISKEIELKDMDSKFASLLSKIYRFNYDDNTTIYELYIFLYKKLKMDYDSEENIEERFSFKLGKKNIFANINYSLKHLLKNNNYKENTLYLFYHACIGGGNGSYVKGLAHIRINPNEQQHKYLPHVHVYKKNYKKCVRISLNTFEQLKNDKYIFKELFSNKEIHEIISILKEHQEELINYYNDVQNGEKTKDFIIEYNKKEYEFK